MDPLLPEAFNPHLSKVLKTYQSAATRSLSGPSGFLAGWDLSKPLPCVGADIEEYRRACEIYRKQIEKQRGTIEFEQIKPVPPFPIQSMPIFTPMDAPRVEKSETILEGETIACFIVGGEKRLCLPQILNTVLKEFSLSQINSVCDELHIYCSRCNPEQLEILKVTGVLPLSAPSCGLITKTDAERLCSSLLYGKPDHTQREPPTHNSFKVYHECFGKSKGIFTPELYTNPYAKCIECCDCHGMFSPQKFVCHSHKAQENRTCHWGFDSANWRSYLLLAKGQHQEECLQEFLDQMKSRFDFMSKFKRKGSPSTDETDHKRSKRDHTAPQTPLDFLPGSPTAYWLEHAKPGSAFRPWSPTFRDLKGLPPPPALMKDSFHEAVPPYLQTGPPVLLNPERVVRHSESNRYERHFAPNVALAPLSLQKKVELIDYNGSTVNIKREPSDITRDYDVDTSDDSVPPTPESEKPSPFKDPDSTLKEELKMMEMAIDGKIGATRENRENFLQEFVNVHRSMEKKMRLLKEANTTLQKEVDVLRLTNRDQLRELTEMKLSFDKQDAKQASGMSAAVPVAHTQKTLEIYQTENAKMTMEIAALRGELHRLSSAIIAPALMSPKKKALCQLESTARESPVDMTSHRKIAETV